MFYLNITYLVLEWAFGSTCLSLTFNRGNWGLSKSFKYGILRKLFVNLVKVSAVKLVRSFIWALHPEGLGYPFSLKMRHNISFTILRFISSNFINVVSWLLMWSPISGWVSSSDSTSAIAWFITFWMYRNMFSKYDEDLVEFWLNSHPVSLSEKSKVDFGFVIFIWPAVGGVDNSFFTVSSEIIRIHWSISYKNIYAWIKLQHRYT